MANDAKISINVPTEQADKARRLAQDQGLVLGDLHRDIFLAGLSAMFESYTKPEVYEKVRGRNTKGNGEMKDALEIIKQVTSDLVDSTEADAWLRQAFAILEKGLATNDE